MWQVTIPALVAAVAALGGVTLGALVEPLKLRAARLARVRQDRAERSARLIETAMGCRARLLSLNLAHRRRAAGEPPAGPSEEDRLESYRVVRNDFRQTLALLRLSGPDDLVEPRRPSRRPRTGSAPSATCSTTASSTTTTRPPPCWTRCVNSSGTSTTSRTRPAGT